MDEDSNKVESDPSSETHSGTHTDKADYLSYPCFDEKEFIDNGVVEEPSLTDDLEDLLDGVVADNFECPSERRRLVKKKEAQQRYLEARQKALDKSKLKKKVITIEDNDVHGEDNAETEFNVEDLDLQKSLFPETEGEGDGDATEGSPPLEDFVVDNYDYEGYRGVPAPIQKLFAPKYNERTGPPPLPPHKRKMILDEEVSLSPPKRRRRVSTDSCNTPLITNFLTKEPVRKAPLPTLPTPSQFHVHNPTPSSSTSNVATNSAPLPTTAEPSEYVMKLWKRKWKPQPVQSPPSLPAPPPSRSIFSLTPTPPLLSQPSNPIRKLHFPDFTSENSLSAPELPIPCIVPSNDHTPLSILPESTPPTSKITPPPARPSFESPGPQFLLSPSPSPPQLNLLPTPPQLNPLPTPPQSNLLPTPPPASCSESNSSILLPNSPPNPLSTPPSTSYTPTPLQPTNCISPSPAVPSPETPSPLTIPSKRWRLHVSTNVDRKLLILIHPNKTIQDLAKEIESRFKKMKPQSHCSVVSIESKDGFQLSDDYLIQETTTDSGELVAIISET
eukprot:TRINITY_DN12192_c0_g1_i1.p1 TRINITY_DN12192_c0_g1~~TRINITY_DN12192_c0_g1_i1.p1  ORF type:complete len:558 (+),score=125.60 TRINITY_DN12192_c0_g1_i1:43-1716(+)